MTKEKMRVKTAEGIMDLEPGQEVEVPEDLAIRLIHEQKISALEEISPLAEDASWFIYSEVLQDFLWAVPDEEAREKLLTKGVMEAIYTEGEIDLLEEASRETLKTVHAAKKAFPGSEVTPNGAKKR